ncbi:O-succinylhomoserine sulfhydrylase [Coralliovum pocilloporae]|uniref:O-succinylhomoserine sulfhydrylase n=1 Tax=Coralliovum pocilloporae TaxID=3066369 RepID=UPI00330791F4
MSDTKKWRPATELVHGGTLRSQFNETSEALFLTQGYVYPTAEAAEARFKGEDPGYIYSRYANPTVSMFEDRMAALEGAEGGRGFSSGMAAVSAALLAQVEAGDHVVASRALFGSCLYVVEDLLPRYGVSSTIINGNSLEEWKNAVQPNTKAFFLETPTNPTLDVIDIQAVSDIAHEVGARVVIDNVFATPLWQSPLKFGADVVVYSATKHIDGQGRCLGGVVLSDVEWLDGQMKNLIRHTGPSMSPFNAWVLLKGLETLPVRVERQTQSARYLADQLAEVSNINRLIYPGRDDHPHADIVAKQMKAGSTLIAFDVKGGKEAAFKVLNNLKIGKISNNLGDAKTLLTHPATTTHQRLSEEQRAELGITDGLLRLSVGLEDQEDLLEDLVSALEQARA